MQLAGAVQAGKLVDTTADAEYKVSDHLPGPMDDQDRFEVLEKIASAGGQSHVQWMEW